MILDVSVRLGRTVDRFAAGAGEVCEQSPLGRRGELPESPALDWDSFVRTNEFVFMGITYS